jgi:superfamily II DNA/RNA helicase
LQAFEGLPVVAGEYSSLQPQKARSATLEAFRRGDVDMLVSSDAMTRGMDVENVQNVISYDAPVYAKVDNRSFGMVLNRVGSLDRGRLIELVTFPARLTMVRKSHHQALYFNAV